ncbi:MAG: hypothetical protein U0414_18425 [Polyangiaceae bacterium]
MDGKVASCGLLACSLFACAENGGFGAPTDVAFLRDGTPVVSDGYENTRVAVLDKDGRVERQWGEPGDGRGELDLPHGVAVDSQDRIFVADRNNARIQVFSSRGEFLSIIEGPDIGRPFGLEIRDERLYVVDGGDQDPDAPAGRGVVLTLEGKLIGHFSGPGKEPGKLSDPHDIAVDSKGRVYIAELGTKRVQRFTLELPP